MRALNKVDFTIGETEIPISIYSAIEQDTHFKQISNCCKSAVNYKKVCSQCSKELNAEDISKALEVGDELKQVDTTALKLDAGNLNFIGLIEDKEENGVFKNGDVWYLSPTSDSKNKEKTERAKMKFAYLREAFRTANKNCLALINLRGKEHLVILKPYFNNFCAIGVYHFDKIRDITELSFDYQINKDVVEQMSMKLSEKPMVYIKDFKDKREEMILKLLSQEHTETKIEVKQENPLELCNF